MIKMLEQRIDDKRFLRLIRKWQIAGILEEDGKEAMLMWYADDLICCYQYREDERRFCMALGKRLEKFRLDTK